MTESNSQARQGPSAQRGDSPAADQSRRRLLRAAAATPLLATIPSGAAFANTSAFQCVVASKTDSDNQIPPMAGPLDTWVRRPAKVRSFTTSVSGSPQRVLGYSLDLTGTDETRTWYGVNGAPALTPYWGTSPACDVNTQLCPLGGASTDTFVLAIYEPTPDGVNPTAVVPKGFYPISSTQGNRPSEVGNIGLVQSCYCSVYPTISNPDADQQALHTAYCDL